MDPKHPEKGESLSTSKRATVIVNVPNTDMSSATHDLGLQVFRVNPVAADVFAGSNAADADLLLKKLLSRHALAMQGTLPAAKLGDAVKSVQ
jgi:hypothetical protein